MANQNINYSIDVTVDEDKADECKQALEAAAQKFDDCAYVEETSREDADE